MQHSNEEKRHHVSSIQFERLKWKNKNFVCYFAHVRTTLPYPQETMWVANKRESIHTSWFSFTVFIMENNILYSIYSTVFNQRKAYLKFGQGRVWLVVSLQMLLFVELLFLCHKNEQNIEPLCGCGFYFIKYLHRRWRNGIEEAHLFEHIKCVKSLQVVGCSA